MMNPPCIDMRVIANGSVDLNHKALGWPDFRPYRVLFHLNMIRSSIGFGPREVYRRLARSRTQLGAKHYFLQGNESGKEASGMIEYVRYGQIGDREVDGRTDNWSKLSYLG